MKKSEYNTWYPIEEFPQSQYEINKLGQVRNTLTGRTLRGAINKSGYLMYSLTVDGKMYTRFAHLMVAKQFIPNPSNHPIVNHIDENKANPCIDNLEWTTYSDNLNYGNAQIKSEERRSKPINEYDRNGRYLRTWKSAKAIYQYLGIEYDQRHRPFYLVKILTNNDDPDSDKILFANRIFMRYTGVRSDIDVVLKPMERMPRNKLYANLSEPHDVPKEFLFFEEEHVENSASIIREIIKRYSLTPIEVTALQHAINCITEINNLQKSQERYYD